MSGLDQEETYNFFFYGTLCHPTILSRVLHRDTQGLIFQDAILPGYTRHHVKNEDYPAVIDEKSSKDLLAQSGISLTVSDHITRGTFVKGLTIKDVNALQTFEGNQYTRKKLPVRILGSRDSQSTTNVDASPTITSEHEAVEAISKVNVSTIQNDSIPSDRDSARSAGGDTNAEAWVYIWNDDMSYLEPKIWKFETFVQDKANLWTGSTTKEYDEVDEHHSSSSMLEGQYKEGYEDFGHGMSKYWAFREGYLNMNHGAYGSPPKPVLEAMRAISEECEGGPDLYMKRNYLPHLLEARKRVANLIGAGVNEVVLVPGATHGMNNVLREITWEDGDIIVAYNTTYGAVAQTLKYLTDRNSGLSLEIINFTFPITHAEIVKRTEEVLEKYNAAAKPNYTGQSKPTGISVEHRVRGVLIDQIASMPGMKYPVDDLVKLCKKYGVMSMVDAAHAIGQVKVDIKALDPDFWVSNCHKWLYAHRPNAVLYVPTRNQGLIKSSIPTGAGYESSRYPTQGVDRAWAFASQYDWVGTTDWAPFFSVISAMDFREKIGGEDRIMAYCHSLAVAGGKKLAGRWGEKGLVIDTDQGELTAAMLNMYLPDLPPADTVQESFDQRIWVESALFNANAFCGIYVHADRLCARFSCQVWNELQDFDKIATIIEGALEGIRQGKHRKVKVEEITPERVEDLPVQDDQ